MKLHFRLYIIKGPSRYKIIIKKLNKFLKEFYHNNYTLEIINILEHSELAVKDKIFATPTLIKLSPPPIKKVVGDLNDKEKLKVCLEIE